MLFLLRCLPVFLLCRMLAGCGYHPAGSPAHLPNTVHTLAVPVFKNTTQSYHTEVAFTQAGDPRAFEPHALQAYRGKQRSTRMRRWRDDHQISGDSPDLQLADGQSSSFLITIKARVKLVDRMATRFTRIPSYLFRQQYETTEDLASFIQEDNPARCSGWPATLRGRWCPIFWSPSDGNDAGSREARLNGSRIHGRRSLHCRSARTRICVRAMCCWATRFSFTSAAAGRCLRR